MRALLLCSAVVATLAVVATDPPPVPVLTLVHDLEVGKGAVRALDAAGATLLVGTTDARVDLWDIARATRRASAIGDAGGFT